MFILHLTAARYEELDHGYQALVLTIDGREAVIGTEAKPALVAAGLVFLGGEFADRVPAIDFPVPGEPGNVLRLEGYTRDPRVFALWKQFRALSDLGLVRPGPVPLPPEIRP